MRCEEALNQLNARTNGELRAEEAAGLAAHLAECATCRTAADGVQAIDAELRRAFEPRREAAGELAERVLAELARWQDPSQSLPSRPRQRRRWLGGKRSWRWRLAF